MLEGGQTGATAGGAAPFPASASDGSRRGGRPDRRQVDGALVVDVHHHEDCRAPGALDERGERAVTDARRGSCRAEGANDLLQDSNTQLSRGTRRQRHGHGGDPDSNPRLRTVIADAKAVNMPADNIKKAIQRGTGELPGVNYEEVTYEGYGPGGAAVIIQTFTDNQNRTVGELRHMLTKHNGNLGETNSVAWMFSKKGYIVIEKAAADEEKLLNTVLDNGGDDLRDDGDSWEVITEPSALREGARRGQGARRRAGHAQVAMLPQNYVKLEGKDASNWSS